MPIVLFNKIVNPFLGFRMSKANSPVIIFFLLVILVSAALMQSSVQAQDSTSNAENSVKLPTLLWNFNVTNVTVRNETVKYYPEEWSTPAISDGIVYIKISGVYLQDIGHYPNQRTYRDGIYAINESNGEMIWNVTISLMNTAAPIVSNGIVYVGSGGRMLALNASTGSLIWSYSTKNSQYSSSRAPPAIMNGVIYLGSFNDNKTCALNAANGKYIWSYSTGGGIGTPAVANGIVYITSSDHNVYALDATNGMRIWNFSANDIGEFSPVVTENTLLVTSKQNVYALNAKNGEKLWEYSISQSRICYACYPTISKGVVYFGTSQDYYWNESRIVYTGSNNIYALDSAKGVKLWNFSTGIYGIESSPKVAEGVLYFTNVHGDLYAIKAENGEKFWNFSLGLFSDLASAPAIANGTLFIGAGNVYAYGNLPVSTESSIFSLSADGIIEIAIIIAIVLLIVGVALIKMRKKRLRAS